MSDNYRSFGRGGAGNIIKSPKNEPTNLDSSPAPIQHFKSPNDRFYSGRGGAGNVHKVSEMPAQTPGEYLAEVEKAVDKEPEMYAVGRGGQGNIVRRGESTDRSRSRSAHQQAEKKDLTPQRSKHETIKEGTDGGNHNPASLPALAPGGDILEDDDDIQPLSSDKSVKPTKSNGTWSNLKATLSGHRSNKEQSPKSPNIWDKLKTSLSNQ